MSESEFCSDCGEKLKGSRKFCSNCGTKSSFASTSEKIITANLGDDDFDVTQYTSAGVLCFVAACLVAISCFMPYILINSGGLLSFTRTPFQFGAMSTLSYQGPLILLGAAFFVFDGLRLLGIIAPDKAISSTFPLATCIYSTFSIADAWTTSDWSGSDTVSIHLGYGGVVGIAGILVGAIAIYVQRSA